MKFEIDLNDILGDEYGTETIQESIKRQVIDSLVNNFKVKVGQVIDREINEKISKILNEQLEKKFPEMIEDIWNMEYKPVSKYGQVDQQSTTLKNEIIEKIKNELVYKKVNWDSDKNMFTKSVDHSISVAMSAFKKEFDEKVTSEFKKEAFAYALKQLSK